MCKSVYVAEKEQRVHDCNATLVEQLESVGVVWLIFSLLLNHQENLPEAAGTTLQFRVVPGSLASKKISRMRLKLEKN